MEPCNKKCHLTRKAAKAAMKHLNHDSKLQKKIQNVYYCKQCSNWHLTSIDKNKSRKLTRKNNK